MKKLLLSLAVIVGVCSAASATTWRINSNPKAKAHFLTLQDAMSSLDVKSGDVLMLDPGQHAGATISKQVTIVGTGYFLGVNTDWVETASASVSGVLTLTSEECHLVGISVSRIDINADYNIINRCYISESLYVRGSYASVSGCYIEDLSFTNSPSSSGQSALGFTISNCIIVSPIETKEMGIIKNCVIYGDGTYGYLVSLKDTQFQNNIVINTSESVSTVNGETVQNRNRYTIDLSDEYGNSLVNNVINIDPEYAGTIYTNNKYVGNVALTDVFAWGEGLERRFMLSADSPAKGYATDGSDCGAFGGSTPYVLSGIPQFYPHITEVSIPTKTSDNKLKVTLKIVNQNE